jgi:acyl-CoA synthetase (NDP forming)
VTTEEFVRMTEKVLALPVVDLAVLLPTHLSPAMDIDIAERLSRVVRKAKKPVVVSVLGSSPLASMIHREFISKGIPSFPTSERAVRALALSASYAELREEVRGKSYRWR